jgi:hypothetical protein
MIPENASPKKDVNASKKTIKVSTPHPAPSCKRAKNKESL